MELKDYQARALDAFTRWHHELAAAQVKAEESISALRSAGLDSAQVNTNYPAIAWGKLAEAGEIANSNRSYVERTDGAGRPIPHVCFKVPTGGGKTLLAAAALERLNRPTGLTIWIVPSRAIYQQTKDALWSREHPYRQLLDRACDGRVKVLEKDDRFTAGDVVNYHCILLLMLPAANRQRGRDFLRMFRDSGRYPTLFPDSDDVLADGKLLEAHPDLERVSADGPVKHSLFNAFKMLRPVVVLDEAHKAYGARNPESNAEFARAISRLNPSLVIEFSATPNRGLSNLLVDIPGTDLKREEMIKLPVQVATNNSTDWHHTLAAAHTKLEELEQAAQQHEQNTGHYIRPIAVVRVERTGRNQRDGIRIHAEDAREYLTDVLGVPADAVAVKSDHVDELGRTNLLSSESPIRWIITKAALMEGWDCPFAYVLVMLDNTSAQNAITQLVGRVMRQPYAQLTGRAELDQCYVYCQNTGVNDAVASVKRGLEQEGMGDLADDVRTDQSLNLKPITVERRERFRGRTSSCPKCCTGMIRAVGRNWTTRNTSFRASTWTKSPPAKSRVSSRMLRVGTRPRWTWRSVA